MDLTTSQYIQLIVGLSAVIIMFVIAYAAPERYILQFLVMLVPFQPVVTKFGSLNTGLALLVTAAFLLNRRVTKLPLLPIVLLTLFVYLVSTALAVESTRRDHLFYMVTILANVSMFYLFYNFVIRTGRVKDVFIMLIWTNVLVAIYCIIQMKVGFGTASIMGIEDLSLMQNRKDARLAGPFNAVGITAEYMVIQTFVILYMYFHEHRGKIRLLLLGLLLLNMGILVGTGNRAGLVVLVFSSMLFFMLFRRDFGTGRLVKLGSVGVVLFVIASSVMLTFTDFNVLFERLAETEIEEGLPDSRTVIWPLAVERIQESPFIGHGPRIRLIDEYVRTIPGYEFMPYPHSLYLYILYTTGFVGLFVLALAFVALLRIFLRACHNDHPDSFIRGIPKLAVLILLTIAVDQLKVSMMRFNLSDFQQYVAVLLGMFVAASYISRKREAESQQNGSALLYKTSNRRAGSV